MAGHILKNMPVQRIFSVGLCDNHSLLHTHMVPEYKVLTHQRVSQMDLARRSSPSRHTQKAR